MALDLESLRKAIDALGDLLAVGEDRRRMDVFTEVERNGLRAGVIQYFEFTYELSWNSIKRWLQENRDPSVTVGATRRHIFRIAAREGLIHDPEAWMEYTYARNLISHTYKKEIADRVYGEVPAFLRASGRLLAALEDSDGD